jgi:hypothetical protein
MLALPGYHKVFMLEIDVCVMKLRVVFNKEEMPLSFISKVLSP